MGMIDPKTVYEKLTLAGNAMADAQYDFQVLDDATKPMLALNTTLAIQAESCSVAMGTTIALSADQYRDHLKGVAEAKRLYLRAKVHYDSVKAFCDHSRTQEASNRAALREAS
jgi:hypothetical protein